VGIRCQHTKVSSSSSLSFPPFGASCQVPAEVEPMKQCLAEGYPIIFGLKLTQRFFRWNPQP